MEVLKKYTAISLVLYPILANYAVGVYALWKFLMAFSCLLIILKGKEKFRIDMSIKIFLAYAFTFPMFNALFTDSTTNFGGSFLTPILFFLNLYLFLPYLDYDIIKKYYKYVAIFACAVFFLQEFSAIATGHRFSALIPFLKLTNGMSASDFSSIISNGERSCSLFTEPSHFGQFLAPYLAIVLHDLNSKGKVVDKEAILITLVFLLLRSGNGILLCGIIWVVALLFANMSTFKKYMIIIPSAIIISIFGFNYYKGTDSGGQMLERVGELELEQDRVSSGQIRVIRGFLVFDDLDPITKTLGVGAGGSSDVIERSRYFWMFGQRERYLNNASFFLIAYGIIGTLLFCVSLLRICDKRRIGSILLVVSFISLSLMESFIFDTRMLLYISLAMAFPVSYYRMSKEIISKK